MKIFELIAFKVHEAAVVPCIRAKKHNIQHLNKLKWKRLRSGSRMSVWVVSAITIKLRPVSEP